ncbi:hypothetical protein A2164_00265 [Candidatus Curtissbacteria bacterium RBG_13_35_7]|uniref:Macrocin O-methyltransferase n=1 Tax=Candidatus Curtissbacteria bacterium RBG_13_35_7 TaxID=1797705 RepID=A0A1F5G1Z6_9BACT|nr:MAG: hypothetical protein A2164_00265 [Candidatus Curtissbacteria bacterium RBG_13_35_7]
MNNNCRNLYLDLMKRILIDLIYQEPEARNEILSSRPLVKLIIRILQAVNLHISVTKPFNLKKRLEGLDWPIRAHTMIGLKRLDNLQFCVEQIIKKDIPGDLIETGAWRGGTCILMRAILKAYNIKNRIVWVADSFQGLPKANINKYPLDRKIPFDRVDYLKVSLSEVKKNFKSYNLLDKQVHFLKGWFKNTLPKAPITKLALIRIDGDMYESTITSLENLYYKLSIGGYVVIDDFGVIPACRQAVLDYRKKNNIKEKIIKIDSCGVYWQRKY